MHANACLTWSGSRPVPVWGPKPQGLGAATPKCMPTRSSPAPTPGADKARTRPPPPCALPWPFGGVSARARPPPRAPGASSARARPPPPCALPWPFGGGDNNHHSSDSGSSLRLPSSADLLAVRLAGVEAATPSLSILTLRLEDAVPAPGLPRTLRMSVAPAQAALLEAAAAAGGGGGAPAPPPPTTSQPSALDTTEAVLAALGAVLTAAIVWKFDGEVFGAGLCISPQKKGGGGSGGASSSLPVPAKPSDALILALRADAPIYVTHDVWVAAAGGVNDDDDGSEAAPWAQAAAVPSSSSSSDGGGGSPSDAARPLPPPLARILDQLAAADALLRGGGDGRARRGGAAAAAPPPPWSLSGAAARLGGSVPTAAALAEAGRARADAAAALAALAARPLAAARARAGMTLLKMQLAAADERFADAAAARARLDRHVAGDRGMAAAVALEAALEDNRLEDGVRLLGDLLACGAVGPSGWESDGGEE